ncbi:hypothetical protein [Fluviispira multicolorata]|uniref:Uncharacterized protein n=1 Tax=Fluviispira multicolorata TaxID=2654512 RepID=A0A833JD30_9BACT|nr:hypothetical protein [Fluviispira multicolorata]KAB8029997.1 hypothetical protein GCL57_10700 [Fluviispira multicolorata]
MANIPQETYEDVVDDGLDTYALDLESPRNVTDDNGLNVNLSKQIEQIFDTMTRIGGEVCKLRAEMDGLLDQNAMLVDSFHKLKDVLNEKGYLDLDDFQLACDVFDEANAKTTGSQFVKKISH